MKIITTTHYNRPICSRSFFETLSKCDGINEYKILVFLEPGCSKVLDIVQDFSHFMDIEIHENDNLLGCWENKKLAVSSGFERSNFIIHAEDDVIFAKDCLRYFEWASDYFKDDSHIFSVTAFSRNNTEPSIDDIYKTLTRKYYTSQIFGTWLNRFNLIKDKWTGQDLQLQFNLMGDRVEVYPVISRVNNIGGDNQGVISSLETLDAITSCGHREGAFIKNNLIVNPKGREWLKLSDKSIKSRADAESYNKTHTTNFWIDDLSFNNEYNYVVTNYIKTKECKYVDVFVPYYQNLRVLPETINSILSQNNCRPIIHLVNDCSPENDSFLYQTYKQFDNIMWYRTVKNSGPYKINNALYHNMLTDVIVINDSDDISTPNRIYKSLELLESNDIVFGAADQFIDPFTNPTEFMINYLKNRPVYQSTEKQSINGTMMLSKECFSSLNGFCSEYHISCDNDFTDRARLARKKIVYSEDIFILRRLINNSLTNSVTCGLNTEYRNTIYSNLLGNLELIKTGRNQPKDFGNLYSQGKILEKIAKRG